MRVGLARRTLLGSALLALVVGAAFAVMLSSTQQLRSLERGAQQSEEVLVLANRLERMMVDLETGPRGYIITGDPEFLQPWAAARTAFPGQGRMLVDLVAEDPDQRARAQALVSAGESYIKDYADPLVRTAQRDRAAAQSRPIILQGRTRMTAIRALFDTFTGTERQRVDARQSDADAAAFRASAAAAAGLGGAILFGGLLAGYLTTAIVRPVRRVADLAGRLAGGDLSARLPERGVGEIGVLERSFNTMAAALERQHAELAASRSRIVGAADQARRRIERDLHDGTQQRLVSLALDVRAAEADVEPGDVALTAQLDRIADGLTAALNELQETARGIHPATLSESGLPSALKALGRRSSVPVELDVDLHDRLPEPVEVAAYYVVSEALANAAKHARASQVRVEVREVGGELHLAVRDDGAGGAVVGEGSGLTGLADRIAAVGGRLAVVSPPGEGTAVVADLPLLQG